MISSEVTTKSHPATWKTSGSFEAGARAILTMKLNGPTPERRQELAGKANEGLLTAEEFAEYETYAQLRGLLAALQSKARLYLKQSGPA